jgi:formamidopyrimidine-DNA glycosylase
VPELPEVEVVRAGLEPAVTGATITSVDVLDVRSLKRHNVASGIFIDVLEGRSILAASRRGKFLWFPLDNDTALVTHLGMSGQMLLRLPGTEDRLTRIRIGIESPDHGELLVNFVDQRIFGGMAVDTLLPTPDGFPGGFSGATIGPALVPSQVAHIARDALDPAFDEGPFFAMLARKGTGIKRALLDQTLISGIGNIYADEALWAAKVHYEQAASSLSTRRASLVLAEVRAVLNKALAEGGTSFDAQYVNVNGASGYFAHSLNVYGQQGKPCPRCGAAIRREKFMNRSSHFCPKCQRRR